MAGHPPAGGLGFRIHRAIDAAVEEGIDIPIRDDSHHFCLSYHLKGVCNLNCGGRHSHRTMSQGKIGRMTEWRNIFCKENATTPDNRGHYELLWGRRQHRRFCVLAEPPLEG